METQNLLNLVNRLRQLENVTQVRYHQVLKQRFKDMVGEDGVSIVCIVPNKVNPEKFVKVITMLSTQTIENPEMHDSIVADVTYRVEDYIVRNIRPQRFN